MVDVNVIESLTYFNVMSSCMSKEVTKNISVQNASEWNTTHFYLQVLVDIRFPHNCIKGNNVNFYTPGWEVVYPKVIYPCTFTETSSLRYIVSRYSVFKYSFECTRNRKQKRSSYKSFHLVTMLYIFMNTTNCRLKLKLDE